MANIHGEVKFFRSGPISSDIKRRKAQDAAWAKQKTARAPMIRDMYASVANHIKEAAEVRLFSELTAWVEIPTVHQDLSVRVYHPQEVEELGGEAFWIIDYGKFDGNDMVWTSEVFRPELSPADVAYRVDFLLRAADANAHHQAYLRTKYTRRMAAIVKMMTDRREATRY